MKNIFTNRILVPLLLLLAILCLLTVAMSVPMIWQPIYQATMRQELLSHPRGPQYVEDSALISGGLWTNESYQSISARLTGYHLNEKEQSHFEDVRDLLRLALVVSAALLLVLVLVRKRVHWRTAWAHALYFYVGFALLLGLWSAISWRHLFRTLHWWIFQDDSWILPKGSYGLFLYPHSVWKIAGIWLLAALPAILLAGFVIARRSRR
jgi:uncharacterized membrane protein